VWQGCTTAGIGCLDCKQPVIDAILAEQKPWRERAEPYLANPKQVHWIVEMGTERARTVARQTMKDVRDLSWPWARSSRPMNLKPASLAAQALGWIDEKTRAVTPPIHVSSTYLRDPDNQYRSGRVYARADNPAFDQAEAVISTLEGGAAALLFASGMAAATAVFQALKPGDHVLAPKVMYWSLRNWLMASPRLGPAGRVDRHDRPGGGAGGAAARQDQAGVDRDAGQPAVDRDRHRRHGAPSRTRPAPGWRSTPPWPRRC
jgi:hypothetical protein